MRLRIGLGEFVMLWAVAILGAGLWSRARWLLWVVLAGLAGVGIAIVIERRRRMLQGYWVEYVPPAVLRGAANGFAVVYHEAGDQISFLGLRADPGARPVVRVPTVAAWRTEVPPWARERRDDIVARMRADKVARAMEFVEADAPQR